MAMSDLPARLNPEPEPLIEFISSELATDNELLRNLINDSLLDSNRLQSAIEEGIDYWKKGPRKFEGRINLTQDELDMAILNGWKLGNLYQKEFLEDLCKPGLNSLSVKEKLLSTISGTILFFFEDTTRILAPHWPDALPDNKHPELAEGESLDDYYDDEYFIKPLRNFFFPYLDKLLPEIETRKKVTSDRMLLNMVYALIEWGFGFFPTEIKGELFDKREISISEFLYHARPPSFVVGDLDSWRGEETCLRYGGQNYRVRSQMSYSDEEMGMRSVVWIKLLEKHNVQSNNLRLLVYLTLWSPLRGVFQTGGQQRNSQKYEAPKKAVEKVQGYAADLGKYAWSLYEKFEPQTRFAFSTAGDFSGHLFREHLRAGTDTIYPLVRWLVREEYCREEDASEVASKLPGEIAAPIAQNISTNIKYAFTAFRTDRDARDSIPPAKINLRDFSKYVLDVLNGEQFDTYQGSIVDEESLSQLRVRNRHVWFVQVPWEEKDLEGKKYPYLSFFVAKIGEEFHRRGQGLRIKFRLDLEKQRLSVYFFQRSLKTPCWPRYMNCRLFLPDVRPSDEDLRRGWGVFLLCNSARVNSTHEFNWHVRPYLPLNVKEKADAYRWFFGFGLETIWPLCRTTEEEQDV